ncbi:Nop-domain-containing protein [Fragilariopsis cylindrus CCMP1102]|uniref:Nucleolar protein 56 n=1 Tax=Fragilariopsis cylindrus CCMP1102 TaxID=635003 RepID=A0A1E7FUH3_9STRA|nr:Nop-domain-containing protein [Fragilariopsis cylindrus CCMP1102]|eukprot:OEU21755.1 Nop-domain-containing protein [Fragilariopsis cylindrus CCMP1102]
MIIQSIALLDQMDKDLNTFAMRVREWYSWHFPELKDVVKDNIMFARAAAYIQDKSTICPCQKGPVQSAARTSMGMDCSAVDMVNIINFTQRMVKLAEFRKNLSSYLSEKMALVAPNLSTLIGDTVAARLISKAGSLTNLAKAPASTVQILGAEKALFRALKTKGNTPKYGLIYHSTFIGRADAKNKGRISRYLANKCSIATRIDSFSDEPTRLYGEKLREQVEERLKFYETGAAPRRNVDVMEEVAKSLKVDDDDDEEMKTPSKSKKEKKEKSAKKEKKSAKKDKKRKADDDDDEEMAESTPKKSKVDSPKSEKKSEKKAKKEKKSAKKEKRKSKS